MKPVSIKVKTSLTWEDIGATPQDVRMYRRIVQDALGQSLAPGDKQQKEIEFSGTWGDYSMKSLPDFTPEQSRIFARLFPKAVEKAGPPAPNDSGEAT